MMSGALKLLKACLNTSLTHGNYEHFYYPTAEIIYKLKPITLNLLPDMLLLGIWENLQSKVVE